MWHFKILGNINLKEKQFQKTKDSKRSSNQRIKRQKKSQRDGDTENFFGYKRAMLVRPNEGAGGSDRSPFQLDFFFLGGSSSCWIEIQNIDVGRTNKRKGYRSRNKDNLIR